MHGTGTIDGTDTGAALPRLYLRPDEAARAIGISRRTLSEWQSSRVIGFRRIGRTVLFSVADIQTAIDRYRVAPVGEPKRRRRPIETEMRSIPSSVPGAEFSTRKRRIQRILTEPATP